MNVFPLIASKYLQNFHNTLRTLALFIAVLLVNIFLLTDGATAESNIQWYDKTRSSFKIYYHYDDENNANLVLKALYENYPVIINELGYSANDTFFIFLAPTKYLFRKLTFDRLPGWIGGLAIPGKNLMILKSPKWDRPENNISETSVHELVHLILHQAIQHRPVPRWFDEGLAIYYANDTQYISATQLSKALLTHSVIPLEQVDEVLDFQATKAHLAYQQSYTAVRYLIETYGIPAIQTIIANVAADVKFTEAIRTATGADFAEFEAEWYRYIQKTYRWHFMEDLPDLIWLLIPFLFLTGYIMVKLRNRRTIRNWEQEEQEEQEDSPANGE